MLILLNQLSNIIPPIQKLIYNINVYIKKKYIIQKITYIIYIILLIKRLIILLLHLPQSPSLILRQYIHILNLHKKRLLTHSYHLLISLSQLLSSIYHHNLHKIHHLQLLLLKLLPIIL